MIKIDEKFIGDVSFRARKSERKRMNHNFHEFPEDTLQRMLNAIEPGTYIQPHKHENPDKREAFFVLRGRIAVVEFDDDGRVVDHIVLDARKGKYGAEISPRTWHVIISLEPGSVAYEVKDGPYDPENDKIFAPWAPAEGEPHAEEFNEKLVRELKLG
ncbi:MAG: WbuC family cupin fold metalloprotein [Bacteroidales bacterium]|mgnify:CR=1 FL=1|nr:WbuC family cupin fold metalloprotein [Bacteroidales bacterium]MCF8387002.1 WbuC family cupin fold metalloprotein [Bacteroidales bacterium]MCF8397351.1 WbuC family cupin fold metalloprotein [Bacteroidales bacterium]